jgi:hypothetical protein
LAAALKTDVWSLFLTNSQEGSNLNAVSDFEFAHGLINIKRDFDYEFENALRLRGL